MELKNRDEVIAALKEMQAFFLEAEKHLPMIKKLDKLFDEIAETSNGDELTDQFVDANSDTFTDVDQFESYIKTRFHELQELIDLIPELEAIEDEEEDDEDENDSDSSEETDA